MGGYLLLGGAVSLFGSLLLGMLFLLMAVILKRPMLTYPILAAMLFVPHVAVLSGIGFCETIRPTLLIDADAWLLQFPSYGKWVCLVIWAVIAVCLLVGCRRMIKRGVVS